MRRRPTRMVKGSLGVGRRPAIPSNPAGRFGSSTARDTSGRFMLAIRAGERMDRIFPDWIKMAFCGEGGAYQMYDLNQPLRLPADRPPDHYRQGPY